MTPYDDKLHNEYAQQIIEGLQSKGYFVASRTYHDVFPGPMQERMQNMKTDFTTLAIRDDSDFVAVHKTLNKAFTFDIKTEPTKRPARNMALNALPLARHITLWGLFIERCLYIYKDIPYDFECAFWVSETPQPWNLAFPFELKSIDKDGFIHKLGNIFENVWKPVWNSGYTKYEYRDKPTTVGSPDPYVLIGFKQYKEFKKPFEVIDEYTYDN